MKVLVTGSRDWTDEEVIRKELEVLPKHTVLIHGGARGADRIADKIAKELQFTVVEVPANWKTLGKAAGPMRNRMMLDMAPELVLAFPLPESKGTKDCIGAAKLRQIKVKVIEGKRDEEQKPPKQYKGL